MNHARYGIRHRARWPGLVVLLSLSFIVPARAQLSPGKLSDAHAELEGLRACTTCHELGEGVQASRCLDCHAVLRERIEAGRGLHARSGYEACADCHSEHHGRDFELIHWADGVEAFDHELTGHPLEGAHVDATCRACHKPGFIADRVGLLRREKNLERTFLGLGTTCVTCHDDVHAGRIGGDCTACHTQTAWAPAPGFSHDRTSFPLTGKHIGATCAACHAPGGGEPVYSGLDFATCASCHTDVHAGKLGDDCVSCHTTTSWRSTKGPFDHSRTRYPLIGKHDAVPCAGCHGKGLVTRTPAFAACKDCHFDAHAGQLTDRADGGACESCHSVEGFRPAAFTLSDHQQCAYPLEGAHLAVPCLNCHAGADRVRSARGSLSSWIFDVAGDTCGRCHSDAHRGTARLGESALRCEHCHVVDAWEAVTFDHATTSFPLSGRHATVACRACHLGADRDAPARVVFASAAPACETCHSDPHAGQFAVEFLRGRRATECDRCHVTSSWSAEGFDHTNRVRFALDGRHVRVPCASCHPTVTEGRQTFVRYRPLPLTCEACHGPEPPEETR